MPPQAHDRRSGAAACLQPPPRPPIWRSLDDQGRFKGHWPGQIVEIGRGCHYRIMDLGELLFRDVTLDADRVAQVLVALRHGRIDPEEPAEIDLSVGLDR